jgi:Cu+-exporting ATPase
MLTGDNERTANSIAAKLGIKRIIAQVLPHQKEQMICFLSDDNKNNKR